MRGCRPSPLWLIAAGGLFVALSAQPSPAQTKQICLGTQLSSAGSVCRGLARCYVKAMKRGSANVDPACVADRNAKLTNQYSSTESQADCLQEPGATTVWNDIETAIEGISDDLGINNGKCAAKKMQAISRECKQLLRCYSDSVYSSEPGPEPTCLTQAQAKEQSTYDKSEARYMCITTGDAASHSATVTSMSDDIYSYLRAIGTTTSTTSTSSSSTTTTLPGGCPVDGSFTPCMAYRDNPTCKTCVDTAMGPDAGIATMQCTAAGPDCDDAFKNQGCGYAINTSTTCSATCCP